MHARINHTVPHLKKTRGSSVNECAQATKNLRMFVRVDTTCFRQKQNKKTYSLHCTTQTFGRYVKALRRATVTQQHQVNE